MPPRTRTVARLRLAAALALAAALFTIFASGRPAHARVDGVPYLDNDTIGLFRALAAAAAGPPEVFDEEQWAISLIDKVLPAGESMGPARYLIAFSGYAVAQTARHTPAYRAPYRAALDTFIQRMLQPPAWRDWVEVWKGESPLGPDNIMYTGHLVHMMTLYRDLSGDRKYEQPTAFGFDRFRYTTEVRSLAASIAAQAEGAVDGKGARTYGVACEPGRVYLPCNTPHRLNQILFDRMYGTRYATSNDQWIAWIKSNMVHSSGVLYDLYWPYGKGQPRPPGTAPVRDEELHGVYNAWSVWYLDAIDRAWAEALWGAIKARFVKRGAASPYGDGRTMLVDRPGDTSLTAASMNMLATGFGMVAARELGDEALAEELGRSWDKLFGGAVWSDDGTRFGYEQVVYPRVFQNMFPLLARTTTAEVNQRALATARWDEGRFAEPMLERVSDERTFVNQAFYDPAAKRLIVTCNGGAATRGRTELVIANLDAGAPYTVRRDGAVYRAWRWDGAKLVITTPPLGAREESYVIEPGAPPPEPGCNDCAIGGRRAGDGSAMLGVGIAAGVLGLLRGLSRRRRDARRRRP